ncbi:hypothetical protein I7I50_04596 [Histoplasma capsulatum G186AR]|nr:hypothetical protein I7I52_05505 [Histoplasma capsulatum]QSS75458.1 hypothetical protein I7I50_04596 [Histoplasma capsulatum G186AR]
MRDLLWGTKNQRITAMATVQMLNQRIKDMNLLWNRDPRTGIIDYQDWMQAGEQLDLAIRDHCIFNSDARYYDVEDFLYERIQNRCYPASWKVEWGRYQERCALNYEIHPRPFRSPQSEVQRAALSRRAHWSALPPQLRRQTGFRQPPQIVRPNRRQPTTRVDRIEKWDDLMRPIR